VTRAGLRLFLLQIVFVSEPKNRKGENRYV